ncbi:MAG: hypothetical protein ACLUSP_05625 [Christensenellales bacterium]
MSCEVEDEEFARARTISFLRTTTPYTLSRRSEITAIFLVVPMNYADDTEKSLKRTLCPLT